MSGGHWDYLSNKIQNQLKLIGDDPFVRIRWPISGSVISQLADILSVYEHEADWDLSGDTIIENNNKFDLGFVGGLLDIILKALPDELFDRGKWSTIQSWQYKTDSEFWPENSMEKETKIKPVICVSCGKLEDNCHDC